MPASICAHTHTHKHVCTHTHKYIHTPAQGNANTGMHARTHTHTNKTQTKHKHTHTDTHTCQPGVFKTTAHPQLLWQKKAGRVSETRRSKIRWRNVNLPSLASGHCRRMAGHEWERKMSQYAILLLLHSPSLPTVTICGGLASTKNIRQRGWRETHTETLKTALR
jgi:hypothetical protein